MVLNIFIQRTEQVPVELDISAIEEYILLLLLYYNYPFENTSSVRATLCVK